MSRGRPGLFAKQVMTGEMVAHDRHDSCFAFFICNGHEVALAFVFDRTQGAKVPHEHRSSLVKRRGKDRHNLVHVIKWKLPKRKSKERFRELLRVVDTPSASTRTALAVWIQP
jgi:hypothetical protein